MVLLPANVSQKVTHLGTTARKNSRNAPNILRLIIRVPLRRQWSTYGLKGSTDCATWHQIRHGVFPVLTVCWHSVVTAGVAA